MESPLDLLRPHRQISGMSAILLPWLPNGQVDWDGFHAHLERTCAAGLVPAVNMDTGFVSLLSQDQRRLVLRHTQSVLGGRPFIAGAYVADGPDDPFQRDAYLSAIET